MYIWKADESFIPTLLGL